MSMNKKFKIYLSDREEPVIIKIENTHPQIENLLASVAKLAASPGTGGAALKLARRFVDIPDVKKIVEVTQAPPA